jgi:hypothetical protein
MVGLDPGALVRVSPAIYSPEGRYLLTVPVNETGFYWVAAYAMDEEGNVVTSQPDVALVMVVDESGPEGQGTLSHGDLPSYTGTDADFLVQAGNPHFASLRAHNFTTENRVFIRPQFTAGFYDISAVRTIGSSHRDEVAAEQGTPLPFGMPVNQTDLANALSTLDQRFVFFPRPGFYSVRCEAEGSEFDEATVTLRTSCSAPPSSQSRIAQISWSETRREPVGSPTSTFTTHSSARFFIPAAPPDQRVESAQLTASVTTLSTPDAAPQPRLNGKAPVSTTMSCVPWLNRFPEGASCTGFATWDFTAETRALAAAGGGEFTVTPNLMPEFQDLSFPTVPTFRSGNSMLLGVHYPWLHGAVAPNSRALTLTFAAACPNGFSVSATPSSVMPPRPGVVGGTVEVKAEVTTCPSGGSSPSTVEVELRVDDARPQVGTPDANAHLHDRPASVRGQLDAPTCTVIVDPEGTGSCTVTYRPSEIGGVETVVASADGFPNAETRIRVEFPGLVPLPADPARYVLVGAPENHAGTNDPCRPATDPPTSQHSPNHSARPEMNAAVLAIADAMRQETGILIRVNDMSLPMGGLFDYDIQKSWQPGHTAHRIGRDADIGFTGVRTGACVAYERSRLEFRIIKVTNKIPYPHRDHYHVYAP